MAENDINISISNNQPVEVNLEEDKQINLDLVDKENISINLLDSEPIQIDIKEEPPINIEIVGGTPQTHFTQLLDTPNSYIGQSGKVVKVKETEDGLEFGTGGTGGDATWETITGDQSVVNVSGFANDAGYVNSSDLTGNREITLVNGKNLIGYSSKKRLELENIRFSDGTTEYTYQEALDSGKLEFIKDCNGDGSEGSSSTHFEFGKSYWFKTTGLTSVTFLGAYGPQVGESFPISDLMFRDDTTGEVKTITEAVEEKEWFGKPGLFAGFDAFIYYWRNEINNFDTISYDDALQIESWKGYLLNMNQGNISLLFNNGKNKDTGIVLSSSWNAFPMQTWDNIEFQGMSTDEYSSNLKNWLSDDFVQPDTLNDYWKSDGSSLATGNWNIGAYTLNSKQFRVINPANTEITYLGNTYGQSGQFNGLTMYKNLGDFGWRSAFLSLSGITSTGNSWFSFDFRDGLKDVVFSLGDESDGTAEFYGNVEIIDFTGDGGNLKVDKDVTFSKFTDNGFLKTSNSDGTLSVDTSTYLDTTTAGTTYVPYTGATSNVDLGIRQLTANSVNAVDGNNYAQLDKFGLSIANLPDFPDVRFQMRYTPKGIVIPAFANIESTVIGDERPFLRFRGFQGIRLDGYTNGFLKTSNSDGTLSVDTNTYEPSLGNPSTDGYVLSSTTDGTRSWIEMSAGGSETIGISIDGAGQTITTGEKGRLISRYTGTIKSWALTTKSNESGNIVFNIKKNGTSLVGAGTKPNLSSQSSNTSEISDWDSVSIAKDDIITFDVTSSTVKWINLNLEVEI